MTIPGVRTLGILITAAAAVVGLTTDARAQDAPAAGVPPTYEELARIAGEVNRTLPTMVSARTELFQATALPPNTFAYSYRLIGVTADERFVKEFPTRLEGQKSTIVNPACSTPEVWSTFLSREVTMRYSYYDQERVFLGSVDVVKADCAAVRSRP